MKKYKADWKNSIVFIIGWVILLVSTWSKPMSPEVFTNWSVGLTVLIAVIILLVTQFSYVTVSNGTLRFVFLLFYRRTVEIRSITEINDQPTYKTAKGLFRSLYIFYKEAGNNKWIELRITIFSEKTLGKLIKDLKANNPQIELNKYSQKLMESVA